jgi:hypothetical protein
MDESRDVLRASFLEVVDNQLRDGTPLATRQTFERLQREGLTASKAKELIAAIVAAEVFNMVKHKRTFDERRFVERSHQLPKLPWDDDDAE